MTDTKHQRSTPKSLKTSSTLLCLLSASVLVLTALYALRLEDLGLWVVEEEFICTPPGSIFFLKVHKCASSSVLNVLLRLSERLQLQVALPSRGNYFGHPESFQSDMVWQPFGTANNSRRMLVHHMRMDPAEVTKVVGEDAVWLTILRRPVDQFISMFEFYNLEHVWNISLAEYAAMPTNVMPPTGPDAHFFPNQMAFDMGYDVAQLQDDDLLHEELLDSVQRRFSLVMISDLLDESLVLLRHRLCLDWDDVVVFRHNVRPPRLRSPAALNVSLRRQLRHHLAVDASLYHHFHRRLRQAVRERGVMHVERDKATLRSRVLYWVRRCRGWQWNWPGDAAPLPPPPSAASIFAASAKDVWMCSRLFAHELTYTDHLRQEQEMAEQEARQHVANLREVREAEAKAHADG